MWEEDLAGEPDPLATLVEDSGLVADQALADRVVYPQAPGQV
jgi:hypothetical protein